MNKFKVPIISFSIIRNSDLNFLDLWKNPPGHVFNKKGPGYKREAGLNNPELNLR